MTALVALAFLLPLGFSLQGQARQRALDDAQRRGSLVAGALTATGEPKAVQKAIAAATADGVPPVVHRVATVPPIDSRARGEDVTTVATKREALVADVAGGAVRLEPVKLAGGVAVVEVFVPQHRLRDGVSRDWWMLIALAAGLIAASVVVADR
ncbi:MAG: two-component sensor histidine kinase, partial [Micromonospora sp.]